MSAQDDELDAPAVSTIDSIETDNATSDALATTRVPRTFSIVVAMTVSRAIGQDGKLPWGRLPNEMAGFRNLTRTAVDPAKTNALIMGRLTFESLPRRQPLPGRINVVLTRRPPGTDTYPEGVLVASSLDEALKMVTRAEKVFVIGGAKVYDDAVIHPACAGIWITQITDPDYPKADAFFPSVDDDGAYEIAEVVDEPRQECGVSYRRFYRSRRAVYANK